MNKISLNDGYETSAPQWTDFTAMTPSSDLPSDDYFDRSHEELEASRYLMEVPKLSPKKLGPLQKTKLPLVNTAMDAPKIIVSEEPEEDVESTFINEIDEIYMTPIKVTSPKLKNREPIVLQELSIDEVLSSAMRGIEIASSLSKKTRKFGNPNTTIGSNVEENIKTPGQRKIRLSRSMHCRTPMNQASFIKPNTRQNSSIKKSNLPTGTSIVTEKKSIKTTDNNLSSEKSIENIENQCANLINKSEGPKIHLNTSVDPSSLKSTVTGPRKIRLSKSMHSRTPNNRVSVTNTKITPSNVKLEKKSLVGPINDTDVSDTVEKPSVHIDPGKKVDTMIAPVKIKVPLLQLNAGYPTIKQAVITPTELTAQPVAKNRISRKSEKKEIKVSGVDETVIGEISKPEEAQAFIPEVMADDQDGDFKVFEDFRKQLDEEFPPEAFKVHHSKNVEQRATRRTKPTVVVNTVRRRSSILSSRRRSNKYVSLAEAVSTFQRSTPTRFHTVSLKKDAVKPGPVQKTKLQTLKLTQPKSPVWHGKTRTRKPVVSTEELELQNVRKKAPSANPVASRTRAASQLLKPISKRPQVTRPTNLGEQKKLPKPGPSSGSAEIASTSFIKASKPKKVTALTVSDDGKTMENTEILHFGIPITEGFKEKRLDVKRKVTCPRPFNLEERNKKFLDKKQEKMKLLQAEEDKKLKVEFHARPVPAAVKKVPSKESKEKPQKAPTTSKVTPFSFEERDKLLAKKKEEKLKKIEEDERKIPVFHANPVPVFKPVAVRATSRESVRSENDKTNSKIPLRTGSVDNLTSRNKSSTSSKANSIMSTRGKSAENLKHLGSINPREKSPSLKAQVNADGTKKPSATASTRDHCSGEKNGDQAGATGMPALKPRLKALPVELHSDRRARLRREFDEKLKLKMEQDEERRRKDQEARIAREQAEIAKMRKNAEIKARPMPVYKPMISVKSTKPLTEAQSPAWAKSKR